MKNFFQKNIDKDNPFINNENNKGDDKNIMDNDINETKQNEEAEVAENNAEENEVEEKNEENIEETNNEAEKLKIDFENLNNQYIRLAADFENYRKRQMQEREALLKYGAEECMKKVIEVVDNFDRAMQAVEQIDNIDKMKETFFVLNKQLMDSLSKLGLEQIKSVGEKFDPSFHDAVMQTPTDEYPEETIIKELQKGYKLGDKVIRPALVDVAVKQ